MKKYYFVTIFICLASLSIYATEFKLGIGGGTIFALETSTNTIKDSSVEQIRYWESFGYFLFFDATYVEANLNIFRGFTHDKTDTTDIHGNNMFLDISILVKYPFHLGRFEIFPLLGICYRLVLFNVLEKDKDDTPFSNNLFGFQGGVGTDFSLTEKLYLRGEFLIDAWIRNNRDKELFNENFIINNIGFIIKIGLGYSF